MVEDLSRTSVFSSPRTLARGRLLDIKQGQGTYQRVDVDAPVADSLELNRLPRFGDEKAIADAQAPEAAASPATGLQTGIRIGVVAAASVLGGILGGGVLGAVLAGAGASGLMGLLAAKPGEVFSRLSRWLNELPVRMNTAAGALMARLRNEPAPQPEVVRELAKERLKGAILGAAVSGAADVLVIRFAGTQADSPFKLEGVGGGFRATTVRFGGAAALDDSEKAQDPPSLFLPLFTDDILLHLPMHNLYQPAAVIDIGSSGTKLAIIEPGSLKAFQKRVSVPLGKSLAKNRLDAATVSRLETVLLDFKQILADRGVPLDNVKVVATAGLRDVRDDQGERVADRLGAKLGTSVEIIDPVEEATYVYRSVLRGIHKMNPHQRNLVVEVGGGSTEFAFGKGQRRVEKDLTAQGYLPMGSQKLMLGDPFDPIDVALARDTVKTMLREHIDPQVVAAAKGRPAFIARNDVMKALMSVESGLSDAQTGQRGFGSRHIYDEGLDTALMDWYLSPEGLTYLRDLDLSGTLRERFGKDVVGTIVKKLVILRESADYMGVGAYRLGASGGMKSGILDELIRNQIGSRAEQLGLALNQRYQAEYPIALERLRQIFPAFADQIDGRCKDAASIADKLYRKGTRSEGHLLYLKTPQDVAPLIGDGHGLSLVLEDTSRENIARVRDDLIQAIRRGDVQVLEINNFRGSGADALPYFTQDDIERIRMASEMKRRQAQPGVRSPITQVLDGPGAVKPSGYTTTQINLRLRNPQTGEFDLPILELQIRGKELNDFYAAEHLVYDIRQGKNIYKNNDVREAFEPDVAPLLKVIEEMSQADFERFTDYLSQYYLYCRRLENGYVVPEPKLPEDLPEICNVDAIKQLSQKQRALIKRFSTDYDSHDA